MDADESRGVSGRLRVESDPDVSSLRGRNASAAVESSAVSASEDSAPEPEDVRNRCREAKSCGTDGDNGCVAADSTVHPANSRGNEMIGSKQKESLDLSVKFTYRASSPAHLRVKESPLSSSNIFQQVRVM